MSFKKLLNATFVLSFIFISFLTFAEETPVKLKLYGFVRNDFFYNSRQNVEGLDGVFNIIPKPVSLNSQNDDTNALPQAEMISITTRVGADLTGNTLLGAKSSAKIEADFAGFGTTYYVFRIRHAYFKLNWAKTELLVGQTWHPLFGNVLPTTLSLNTGAPFQPFNRSPQIRIIRHLNKSVSIMASAMYEMQYLSQGPLGASNTYMKNSLLPDLFIGSEFKSAHWLSGVGFETKTIKPTIENLTSISAVAYTQLTVPDFQLKAKAVWGQNLSDCFMLAGYGINGKTTDNNPTYTNFNLVSSWLNLVYGTKWQAGLFLGFSKNLGTSSNLLANVDSKFTAYGCGYYQDTQLLADRLIRVAPHFTYNISNFRVGMEYDFSTAIYGTLQVNGTVKNPYTINNHRVMASASYFF